MNGQMCKAQKRRGDLLRDDQKRVVHRVVGMGGRYVKDTVGR